MDKQITTNSVPVELEKKIKTAIELKKQLAQYEREIKDELHEAMLANNILSIKNDSYTISMASRASYNPKTNEIPTEFQKVVLDTSKCATHEKLYGELPEGIEKNVTQYITWRAK